MPYAPLLFFNFAVVKRAQTGVRLNVCVCVWDEQKVCRWKDYWRFLSGEQSHCLGGKYVHGNWKDGRRNSKWPFLCSFIHFSLKTKTKKQWCFDAVCSLFSDSFSQLLKKPKKWHKKPGKAYCQIWSIYRTFCLFKSKYECMTHLLIIQIVCLNELQSHFYYRKTPNTTRKTPIPWPMGLVLFIVQWINSS